ncbi:hypothetical protein MUG78_16795 [Gordonia alkaliphila]|uniref:hypothetical protein n=1 Tax=Gordonia alkaliphila TaxID=1053547 RepID=UPI001FF31169|nr:hypothetical protein [Gordonia alkaliphila]MCK0441059.1 hypothetical protein [Gordonia alkaliphila]
MTSSSTVTYRNDDGTTHTKTFDTPAEAAEAVYDDFRDGLSANGQSGPEVSLATFVANDEIRADVLYDLRDGYGFDITID